MSDDEDLKKEVHLEWRDYVALVIAMLETVLVPILVVILILVLAALFFIL
ncbi:MAG: hypothetical protein ABR867_03675 [Nitrososphaerales archaeon]